MRLHAVACGCQGAACGGMQLHACRAAASPPLVALVDVILHHPEPRAGGRQAVEQVVLLVAGAPQVPFGIVDCAAARARGWRRPWRRLLLLLLRQVGFILGARLELARAVGLELLNLACFRAWAFA